MSANPVLSPSKCYPIKVRAVKTARPMDLHYDLIFTAEEVGNIIQAVVSSTLKSDGSHKEWVKQSMLLIELN